MLYDNDEEYMVISEAPENSWVKRIELLMPYIPN